MPNAAPQPLPEAGARHERTLEAVGCRRWFGQATPPDPRLAVLPASRAWQAPASIALPGPPVDHCVKRGTPRGPETGAAGVGYGNHAGLIDLRIRDAQDLRRLFLKQQVQRGPRGAQPTGAGG